MAFLPPGGKISTDNSTSTPLGISGVFTGTAEDISQYGIIVITTYADEASATDGLSVQFSSDATNWDSTDVFTVPAATGKTFSFQAAAQYFRVVYTNGTTAQTEFRLQTSLKQIYTKPSSHRIQDAIVDEDDAELVKSVLTAKKSSDGFVNIEATDSNNLRVTEAESGLAIAKGDVTGTSFIHKFGKAPDFDAADNFVTIWDGANDGDFSGSPPMNYTYSATANIDTLSSSNAGDSQTVEIQGLDGNYALVTQSATLNGQSDVILTTPLLRVFRLKNTGTTDFAGDVWLRTNGSGQSGGVPTTANTVRLKVSNGNNQTLMAIYSVPAGKTAYIRKIFAGFDTVTGGFFATPVASKIQLFVRPFGQVFQLKYDNAIISSGSSVLQEVYSEPEVVGEKSDIELRAETNTTATAVSGGFDIVLVDD